MQCTFDKNFSVTAVFCCLVHDSVTQWLVCQTGEKQTSCLVLTHHTVEFGPGQAAHAHLTLSLSSIICY